MNFLFNLVFSTLLTITCGSSNHGESANRDASSFEKFEFTRKEPANELGIFTKVIAQSHRKANQTVEEFSINREFMSDDFFEAIMIRCKSKDKVMLENEPC